MSQFTVEADAVREFSHRYLFLENKPTSEFNDEELAVKEVYDTMVEMSRETASSTGKEALNCSLERTALAVLSLAKRDYLKPQSEDISFFKKDKKSATDFIFDGYIANYWCSLLSRNVDDYRNSCLNTTWEDFKRMYYGEGSVN